MTLSIQRRGFSVAVLSSCCLPDMVMAQGQAPLEMGLLPNISARTLLSQYRPLREYLAHVLQRPVHLSTASDWTVFHGRVATKEHDLVATASHMARLIKSRLLEFASPRSSEGAVFLSATGFTGLREIPPGVLTSMDAYVNPAREMLARAI